MQMIVDFKGIDHLSQRGKFHFEYPVSSSFVSPGVKQNHNELCQLCKS